MTSNRLLQLLKAAAVIAVGVPALWVAFMAFREALADSGGPGLNTAFHLGLGIGMLLLLADFAAAISRTSYAMTVIALGTGGFVAASTGAILSELFGPLVLLALLAVFGAWAAALLRSRAAAGNLDTASGPSAQDAEAG